MSYIWKNQRSAERRKNSSCRLQKAIKLVSDFTHKTFFSDMGKRNIKMLNKFSLSLSCSYGSLSCFIFKKNVSQLNIKTCFWCGFFYILYEMSNEMSFLVSFWINLTMNKNCSVLLRLLFATGWCCHIDIYWSSKLSQIIDYHNSYIQIVKIYFNDKLTQF